MWGAGFLRGDLLRLIYEGFAVGTLDFGRIGFMGTDLNLIQCAVIFALGVMSTVVDSTSDGFVLVGHHKNSSFMARRTAFTCVTEVVCIGRRILCVRKNGK